MNLINNTNKDKKILHDTALKLKDVPNETQSSQKTFPDSYFKKSCISADLIPYSFDTVMDLKSKLMELWNGNEEMKKFIPVVLVSAFKLKPNSKEERKPIIEHKDESKNGVLPVYTYTL